MENERPTPSKPSILRPGRNAPAEAINLNRQRRETALREAQAIALAELARRRKRLGTLSREQEIALENLVAATATKISDLSSKVLESLPTTV